jgi:transposase
LPGKDIDTRAVTEAVLTDELWQRLEPLLPVRQRRFRYPGRLRTSDRAALEGILFAARTGIAWNDLPTALFGASGATCWRRLKEWYEAGVWQKLHEQILAELRAAGRLDLSAALVDASHLRALKGGCTPVPARSTGAGWAASTI